MKKLNKVLVTTALVAGSFSPAAAFAATTNSPSDTLANSLTNTATNLSGSLNNAVNQTSGSLNNAVNQTSSSLNTGVDQLSNTSNNGINNSASTLNNASSYPGNAGSISNSGTSPTSSGFNGSSLIPLDGTNHNFSTYKLTHTGFNGLVMPTDLISVANKSFDEINQAVQDAVRYRQPIHLTLSTDKLGTMGYSNTKLKVAGSPSNVQLWAKNVDGNWVNLADNGWGPVAGFPLKAQVNESVDLYLMNSGSYTPVKLQLIDLKNPDKIIAEDDITYTIPK